MKKAFFFAIFLCMAAGAATAHDTTGRIGLGFNSTDAPVGLRYWFTPKVGVDVGIGFSRTQSASGGDDLSNFTVAGALPINIHRLSDRVNFNFLPMLTYNSVDVGAGSDTEIKIDALLEFEAFVTEDLTVSAAQGLEISLKNPDNPLLDSTTDFSTFGANITEFGVHYYIPSAK